jgi:hypothetical protein
MAQPPLISSGTVDIAPQRPLMLGGFAKRTEPFRGVADRLEANVLVVRGVSSRAVIVTTDLLYPGETLKGSFIGELGSHRESRGVVFVCITYALRAHDRARL